MSEKPHCAGRGGARRWSLGSDLCNEELRSLIKSSDFPRWKFWRLTLVIRVLIGKKVALLKKAMKMQRTEGVCTVEAGQCIQ